MVVLLAPSILAGTVTTYTSPYSGGCLFSSPWTGTTSSGTGTVTFTGPTLSSGSGGIDAFASGSQAGSHAIATEFVTLVCISPAVVDPSGSHLSVKFHIAMTASYSLSTSCSSGGSASASTNASVLAWMYGGTPSGSHGAVSASLFNVATTTCGAHLSHNYGAFNQVLTTGTFGYGSSDYFDFHLRFYDTSNAAGYPRPSGGNADGALTFTVSSEVMTTS